MINLSKNFRMMEQMLRDRAEYIHQIFYSADEDFYFNSLAPQRACATIEYYNDCIGDNEVLKAKLHLEYVGDYDDHEESLDIDIPVEMIDSWDDEQIREWWIEYYNQHLKKEMVIEIHNMMYYVNMHKDFVKFCLENDEEAIEKRMAEYIDEKIKESNDD